MSDDVPERVGGKMMDDMIDRATASCERIRAKLEETPRAHLLILRRWRGQLRIMEATVVRLKAERAATLAISRATRSVGPRSRGRHR